MKTNAAVTAGEQKEKTLYWCTPWVWLVLLLIRLLGLVLYFILRKNIKLVVPMTTKARRRLTRSNWIAAGLLVAGLVVLIYGGVDGVTIAIGIGVIMMVLALIFAVLKGQGLRVSRIRDGEAWIAGAGPEFLASLPAYR